MPDFCDECFKGVRHEGIPEGQIEVIGGVESYIAIPKGNYPKDVVILLLTDVFGIPLINNKLLADDFARNGFKTIVPDILGGDPLSDEIMRTATFDRPAWMAKHGTESWAVPVDKVVAALKDSGVTRFGTAGYCFGAQPAFYLAIKNTSHVTVVSHPSRLRIPEDFIDYRKKSNAPLLINSCETDPQLPKEAQAKADEILGGGKFAPGYERTYWEGCTHGFSVRGDLSNPKVKAGKEGSFEAAVKFFKKYLLAPPTPSRL